MQTGIIETTAPPSGEDLLRIAREAQAEGLVDPLASLLDQEDESPPPTRKRVPQPVAMPADEESEVLTSADLTAELPPSGRRVPIGRNRHVWVHPLSGQGMVTMCQWAATLKVPAPASDDPQYQRALAQANVIQLGACQAILCCRTGPEPNAPACFKLVDHAAVLKYLGHAAIQRICQVSNELGGAEETLGPGRSLFSLKSSSS